VACLMNVKLQCSLAWARQGLDASLECRTLTLVSRSRVDTECLRCTKSVGQAHCYATSYWTRRVLRKRMTGFPHSELYLQREANVLEEHWRCGNSCILAGFGRCNLEELQVADSSHHRRGDPMARANRRRGISSCSPCSP